MSCLSRRLLNLLVLALPALASSPSVPGINNFHEVDEAVYRGAQPTDDGFRYLAKLGVKVVVDLREHDDRSVHEGQSVTAAGMRYINVPMTGMTPPSATEINTILTLLEDPAAGPVFVHCKRGADRTGAVIAAYRIDHDRWDGARALKEAMASGMSRLQFQRQKYISTFQARTRAVADARLAAGPEKTDAGSVSSLSTAVDARH